mmetsp:Transcript_44751/g.108044  ORF Transcript_44751/g.108044 Transcript_44751/m.108044 type:complete len:831 (+) Transcript_44751:188-2680(+)
MAEVPTPVTPSTPNRNGYPDVAADDYEKALMSDDEEAYLAEFIGGGAARRDSKDALDSSMAEVSVTSNFTDRFFPPSPTTDKDLGSLGGNNNDNNGVGVDVGGYPDVPVLPAGTGTGTGNTSSVATPVPNIRQQQATTTTPAAGNTPLTHVPPTQYVVNDPTDHYDDDISTIANDTYVAKYMAADSNPNQLPATPKTPYPNTTPAADGQAGPASPDHTDGASQPTHIYTYNKLPKQKTRFQNQQVESSTSEESGVNTTFGKMNGHNGDGGSVFSLASSYKRFRGGSGWSRKNYMIAIIMSLFLLAVIAGLGYTFLRLQHQQDKQVQLEAQRQNGEPDANGSLNNPLPGDGSDDNNVFGDGWTLRPTGNPVPTPAPTIERSNAPSPIGPSPRPTPPPSPTPTRRPTTTPSLMPTMAPSVPPTLFPTGTPSLLPTMTRSEVLRQLLLEITTGETLMKISIPGTPQQRAFEWLHQDPNFLTYLRRRQIQRFALAVLYYSTTQPEDAQESLQTWMQYESNECTWFNSWFENRFPCGSDDIYKFVTLRNINLVGTIPSELALLTKLNSLVLSNNGLSGTIPKEFGEWDSLENLDLRGNYLTGRIPDLKDIPNIKNITLTYNWLTGNVPPSITKLNKLQHLDLTENSLFGFLPDKMCDKGLQTLAVDCDQVVCTCCTQCGSEETRAPVVLPPSPPTPPPTRPPTKPPTPVPTFGPTGCMDAIQVTKTCYSTGEAIIVNFRNCNPSTSDWIGIYPDSITQGQHFNPSLWKWSCNSQTCAVAISRGTTVMDATATGGSLWPLAGGEYKAWLMRRGGDGGAYPAVVGTTKFIVRNGNCW